MRFIITSRPATTDAHPDHGQAPPPSDDLIFQYMKFNEDMYRAGVLVAAEGLTPGAKGAQVVAKNGKRTVVDGPFAESKELVGGFYVIDVSSLDEAIQWAMRCPVGLGFDDVLEIRQLTGSEDLPPEMLKIVNEAAPTWSASFIKDRSRST